MMFLIRKMTHLIRKMVQTTTKISSHVLKLIQDGFSPEEEDGANKDEGREA